MHWLPLFWKTSNLKPKELQKELKTGEPQTGKAGNAALKDLPLEICP